MLRMVLSYFFIFTRKGNLSLEKSTRKKPCDWLPDQGWEDIVKLADLFPEQFGTLHDDVEKSISEWKSVSDHSEQNQYHKITEPVVFNPLLSYFVYSFLSVV